MVSFHASLLLLLAAGIRRGLRMNARGVDPRRDIASSFHAPLIGASHQGAANIDTSGSTPTPNAMDTTINPIETSAAHTMNLTSDESG
jgi:hypothetical protein